MYDELDNKAEKAKWKILRCLKETLAKIRPKFQKATIGPNGPEFSWGYCWKFMQTF